MADDNGSIPSTDKRCNIAVAPLVCFGGEDWWYHNRGHYDMQIVRRFAKNVKTLYVNSIVMRKPVISEGRHLARCIVRKAKASSKASAIPAKVSRYTAPFLCRCITSRGRVAPTAGSSRSSLG